ncbi:hypothetical protein [Stratiformator vulcanicus]|uniref:Uncharacterized protein n=1 Tax=Stratiformator vulcanicus TaxID=2527980 RepID=A0A517R2G5_9PLAN|nr:hypothetical protein [Stratiformator vulcanicus]QDT38076.1 hypothetical protein Pan189_24610 [Stratiformator vulcanicus]
MPQTEAIASQRFETARYLPVWEIGTGLPLSLAPGAYELTGRVIVDGRWLYEIDHRYRTNAREVIE